MDGKRTVERSALINMLLYIFLLVATPFLLVRNYLQQAIGTLSRWSYGIGGLEIPYVLSTVILILLVLLFIHRKRIRQIHFLIVVLIVVLIGIGQSSTDYYFNHAFYELQQNWHYFAYGFFAWISYLYHKSRNASRIRYIWQTLLLAVLISIFDETAQIFISGRVFDICDNGKDIWGTTTGLIVVLLLTRHPGDNFRFVYRKLWDNFLKPWSSIFIISLFSLIFLNITSLLSSTKYILSALSWSLAVFILLFLIIYLLQFRLSRLTVILLAVSLSVFVIMTIHDNPLEVIQKESGLLSWRGIKIPWFDVMIKPSGVPRLVDKKKYFNKKDKINRIYGLCEDILLIGSGSSGQGGRGFSMNQSHFVFNPVKRKPLQILIYPNHQACRIYNRLTNEGRKVLFIIHNS